MQALPQLKGKKGETTGEEWQIKSLIALLNTVKYVSKLACTKEEKKSYDVHAQTHSHSARLDCLVTIIIALMRSPQSEPT